MSEEVRGMTWLSNAMLSGYHLVESSHSVRMLSAGDWSKSYSG
jgi:hypothetical protein